MPSPKPANLPVKVAPPTKGGPPVKWALPIISPEVNTAPRLQFRPAWAKTPATDQKPWPNASEWDQIEVVCTTPGCANQDYHMMFPYIGQPILCGVCGARLDHVELGI